MSIKEITPECTDKRRVLEDGLKGMKRVALAFSGGVDSTFLLALASRAGLEKVLAITVSSPFFTRAEKALARKLANSLGVAHICLDLDILEKNEVVQNTPERCYFCKGHIFSLVRKTAIHHGIDRFLHAVNTDDLGDFRPGLAAAKELGFVAPLADAGFSKQEIRACSRQMGLATWDLASQSCLATRIPYHEPITREKLGMIAQGEAFLRELGFGNVRVRCHGTMARIEMEPGQILTLAQKDMRQRVSRGLKQIGFSYVAFDLDGYTPGNMNNFLTQ
ncbi:MAG: ATP-dependent sacrificial sulfur transferase LarE [Proteobacteria bacterium]|nr:ATP-dependent sacrificial sulfur transferase LarE [Pseudomonadota bacterium]